jgi:hypothetical protein
MGISSSLFGQDGAELLIITHDDFAEAIQNLAQWKYMKGMQTKVVKLSEIGPNPDTTAIRNYIINAWTYWDPSPEYILLVGDTTKIPCFRCFGAEAGCSDNDYANLVGDYRAEIVVGRFSVASVAQCNTLIAKTLGYERTPSMQDPSWFKKATLIVNEDLSGNEPYWFTIDYAYDQLIEHGYTIVDRFCDTWGDDFSDVIEAIDDGRTIVAYRGQSGSPLVWDLPFSFYPTQLDNGWKLPVVISGSCGTGLFTQTQPAAMCNSWTRAGDAANPKGALAWLGTSTIMEGLPISWCRGYTVKGFFKAIFEEDMYALGDALFYAKDFMADNPYSPPNPYPDCVEQEYDAWNLIGDPTLELWTEIPQDMSVHHPAAIASEVPVDLEVTVEDDASGEPIGGALVTLYKPVDDASATPEVFRSEFTSDDGTVVFANLIVPTPGILKVTVTYRDPQTNYVPYQGNIQVKMMTDDPLALAYNSNRHMVRKPNSEELHLVYTNDDKIIYRYSMNGGTDWSVLSSVGEGTFPAIALSTDDHLASLAWTDNAGGLWYRKQIDEDQWSQTYHLWNPTNPDDMRLNSPPSIAIHASNPNTVHILVTRSGGSSNRARHSVEDFMFTITQPGNGSFVLIEQTSGPLEPALRSFPSIARCEVNNSLHATWQRVDTICYAVKPRNDPWLNWGPQFGFDGLQSAHPFVETYGDSIFVVWQHLEPSTMREDVYRGRRHISWPFYWANLSQTPLLYSIDPVNAFGFFTVYAEETAQGSPYDIYYKVRPNDDRRLISNTAYNSLYPQCAARFTQLSYLYTAWQDGDEAPYEIRFKKMEHVETKDMAYLTSSNGHNPPSPYLVARDSFIADWQIPVDIGNMATTYQFPLIPGYAYKAKAVIYHEGSGPWSGRIKIDNNLQFVVTYNANVPETLECWIPPALYEDSVLSVSFNRIAGDFAAIGPIYIYRYEYEGGGGPMSQQSQPVHNTSITVFPNPFTENLNITYQVAGQNGADLKLYDVTGRLVKQFDLPSNASFNHIIWDGVDDHGRMVPQGVYFLRVDKPDSGEILCQKVLKVK